MIIDAWAQHPTLRHIQSPIFESLWRWTKSAPPAVEPTLAATVASMDAAGVNKALISAWQAPRLDLISNDEVADCVRAYPERFIGVGSVDVSKPMEAVQEIRRCVEDLGFKAIRVLPWLCERPPTDRLFYPVYTACCDLGVPFCTQIGHTGPLMPSEVGRPIYLDQVALDFPELVIVAGHIGYPWTEEAIAVATKHESIFIDTSAYSPNRFPPEIVRFMKAHGRHKVLYGSNFPMLSHAKSLDGLEAHDLSTETKSAFLSENAKRVFKL